MKLYWVAKPIPEINDFWGTRQYNVWAYAHFSPRETKSAWTSGTRVSWAMLYSRYGASPRSPIRLISIEQKPSHTTWFQKKSVGVMVSPWLVLHVYPCAKSTSHSLFPDEMSSCGRSVRTLFCWKRVSIPLSEIRNIGSSLEGVMIELPGVLICITICANLFACSTPVTFKKILCPGRSLFHGLFFHDQVSASP